MCHLYNKASWDLVLFLGNTNLIIPIPLLLFSGFPHAWTTLFPKFYFLAKKLMWGLDSPSLTVPSSLVPISALRASGLSQVHELAIVPAYLSRCDHCPSDMSTPTHSTHVPSAFLTPNVSSSEKWGPEEQLNKNETNEKPY